MHKLTPAFTHERDSGGYRNKAMGGGGGGGRLYWRGGIFLERALLSPPLRFFKRFALRNDAPEPLDRFDDIV